MTKMSGRVDQELHLTLYLQSHACEKLRRSKGIALLANVSIMAGLVSVSLASGAAWADPGARNGGARGISLHRVLRDNSPSGRSQDMISAQKSMPWLRRSSLMSYGALVNTEALRGDQLMRERHVEAARRFYILAAAAGSAHGAIGLGSTYDPAVLSAMGARSMETDALLASIWYKRAELMKKHRTIVRLRDVDILVSK